MRYMKAEDAAGAVDPLLSPEGTKHRWSPGVVHLSLAQPGRSCLAFCGAGRSPKTSVAGALQGGHRPAAAGARPTMYSILCSAQAGAPASCSAQSQGCNGHFPRLIPALCTRASPCNTLHSPVPALPLYLQLLLPTANDLHQGCQVVPSVSRRIQSL